MYQPYEFKLCFRQHGQSFTVVVDNTCQHWLPGDIWQEQAIPLPTGLKPGTVKLSCLLQHVNLPDLVIRFANQGLDVGGELPLGKFEII